MEITIDLNQVKIEMRSRCGGPEIMLRYGSKYTFLDSHTNAGIMDALKRLARDVQNSGVDPSRR